MENRSIRFVAALVAALGLAWTAMSVQAQPEPPSLRDISAQQIRLRAQVVAGKGPFKDLSAPERKALVAKQDRILLLLDGVEDIEQLRPEHRVEVFNTIEWVKATVTKAEDERMVCEFARTVGSNRAKSVCMTAKQQREHRENARNSLNRGQMCNVGQVQCLGEARNPGL